MAEVPEARAAFSGPPIDPQTQAIFGQGGTVVGVAVIGPDIHVSCSDGDTIVFAPIRLIQKAST